MNAGSMLSYLEMISNAHTGLNLINHCIAFVMIILLFSKISHKQQYLLAGIGLLMLSVFVNGVYYGNIVHIISFMVMFVFLAIALPKANKDVELVQWNVMTLLYAVFMLLGIWYPEFTHTDKWTSLVLSPLGIVPCPTMLFTMGLMNLMLTRETKRLFVVMLCFVVFYGLIGTFVFKVYFDVFLLALAALSIIHLLHFRKADVKALVC